MMGSGSLDVGRYIPRGAPFIKKPRIRFVHKHALKTPYVQVVVIVVVVVVVVVVVKSSNRCTISIIKYK